MKEIPLINSDKVAIVDDEDFERVAEYRWLLRPDGYVISSVRIDGKQIRLPRFLLKPLSGIQIDHINHDLLDNRRINLRFATQSQNNANRIKSVAKTSEFKGVYWLKNCGKWRAKIGLDNKAIHLGLFESEMDAAIAYDFAAIKCFGEYAKINFSHVITA